MNAARTASPILKAIFDRADAMGVSNTRLAVIADTSKNNILNWRSGKNAPSVMAVEELAAAIGCRLALIAEDDMTLEDKLLARGIRLSIDP